MQEPECLSGLTAVRPVPGKRSSFLASALGPKGKLDWAWHF